MKIHILSCATDGFRLAVERLSSLRFSDDAWKVSVDVLERFRKLGHTVTSGASILDGTDVLVLAGCVCDACCFGSLGTLLLLLGDPYDFFRGQHLMRDLPILIYRTGAKNHESNQLIRGSVGDHCADDVLQYALEQTLALRSNDHVEPTSLR